MKKLVIYGGIGVLVLAALGAAAGGSGNNGVTPGVSASASQQAAAGSVKADLNTPVTVDGVELTILDAQASKGSEFIKPAAGYVFVGYKVRAKALDDSMFVSLSDFSALTDGNKQAKSTITGDKAWEPLLSVEEVRAGATTEGWVVFEAPEPQDFIRLVYDPSLLSDDAKLTYDFGVVH